MKRFPQIFILIIASLWVLSLAVFSYHLMAHTLYLAFAGQSNQSWPKWIFLFQKPKSFFDVQNTPLLDQAALGKSLFLNDTPSQYLQSGSILFSQKDGAIFLELANPKLGDTVKISSKIYNNATSNAYRLSRDLVWKYETHPPLMQISPYTKEESLLYQVSLSNQSLYTPDDIRWYTSDDPQRCLEETYMWNSHAFSPVKAFRRDDIGSLSPVYQLDIEPEANVSCVIAWIENEVFSVRTWNIPVFSFSGKVIEMRSPTINMQTRIRLSTKSRLPKMSFSDAIKHIQISPEIPLSQKNISLGDSFIDLLLPLEASEEYTISLQDISDIYWRTVSYDYTFEPKNYPSLAVKLQSGEANRQFAPKDEIYAQIFASQMDRSNYKMQVCKLEPSQYLRIKQHLETIKKNNIKTYNYISMHSPWSCFQKDISANTTNIKTPFRLDTFSQKLLPQWIYMLSFTDKALLRWVHEFVEPQFFAITDTKIVSISKKDSLPTFFTLNSRNFWPRANEKIYLHLYRDTNVRSSLKNIPRVISVGTTDGNGALTPSSKIVEQIQGLLSQDWIYMTLVSGSQNHLGFIENPEDSFEWDFHGFSSNQTKKSRLYASEYVLSPKDQMTVYGYAHSGVLLLKTPQWKVLKSYEIMPKGDTFFAQKMTLDSKIAHWAYMLEIATKNASGAYVSLSDPLDIYIWWQTHVEDGDAMEVSFVLQSQSIDDKGVPKYLRSYKNTSQKFPWYDQYFRAPLAFEWILKVFQKSPKIPLSYGKYSYNFYELDVNTWKRVEIAGWEGETDTDGFGYIRVSTEFWSYGSDKLYICKLILTNPITGEQVHTSKEYRVTVPSKETYFRDDIPLNFHLKNSILHQWEALSWSAFFTPRKSDFYIGSGAYVMTLSSLWDSSWVGLSGSILRSDFSLDTSKLPPGVYAFSTAPKNQKLPDDLRKSLTSSAHILVQGSGMVLPQELQIIPKNSYPSQGEDIEISFVSPYKKGGIIITTSQGSASAKTEYLPFTGAIITKKYSLSKFSSLPFCIHGQVFWEEKHSAQSLCIPLSPLRKWKVIWKLQQSSFVPGQNIAYNLQSNTSSSTQNTLFFLVDYQDQDNAVRWFESFAASSESATGNVKMQFPEDFTSISLWDAITFHKTYSGTLALPKNISGYYSLVAVTTSALGDFDVQAIPLHISAAYDLQVRAPDLAYSQDVVSAYVDVRNTTESIHDMDLVVKVWSWESEYRSQQKAIVNIGQKLTSRFNIPLSASWKRNEKIRVYFKKWDTIVASVSRPITIQKKKYSQMRPQFTAWFINENTHTGTSISGSLYNSATLSVWSDVRIFLLPLLQSLQWQVSPDANSYFSFVLAYTLQQKITKLLPKSFVPDIFVPEMPVFENTTTLWLQEQDFAHHLDTLDTIVDLKNMGIQVPRAYRDKNIQLVSEYLETNQNNYIFADAYRVLVWLGSKWAQTLYENIDINRLDRHSRIAYISWLQKHRKTLSGALLDEALESVLSWSSQMQRWWSLFADRMILMQVLLNEWKQKEVQKIFQTVMTDFSEAPHVFSVREIREWLRAIYLQSQKKNELIPARWNFSAGKIRIGNTIETKTPYFAYSLDPSDFQGAMKITWEKSNNRDASYILWFFPKQRDPESSIRMTRTLEKIDTTGGLYPDGTFKKSSQVSWNTLEKDVLYRVTLRVENMDTSRGHPLWYMIDVPEVSGAKSFFTHTIQQDWYTVPLSNSHISYDGFSGIYKPSKLENTWNYVYYIKPKFSGKYTFPPSRVYLQSQPNIQASTDQKIFLIP